MPLRRIACLILCVPAAWAALASAVVAVQRVDTFQLLRQRMVRQEVAGRGIRNPQVLEAMQEVPRHLFVPVNQRKFAYQDAALPIGHGQTITSPFVVAYMTDKLDPQPTDRVLEIGTGSGYQASVLSRIVAEVYSIEIVAPLGQRAARTIEELGYDNVHTKIGDGYQGWPQYAPFDKIIVTCSPEKVPPALVQQLKEGGRLIVPLGQRFQQTLYLFQKIDGQLQREKLEATFFVPMTGQAEALRIRKDDSGLPQIVNGDFERSGPDGAVTGWFYVRQAAIVHESTAPQGDQVLLLSNTTPGQNSHVLQAFGADGRALDSIELSASVRTQHVASLLGTDALPRIEVTFYDENRGVIRQTALGPWQGDHGWMHQSMKIPVPGRARLGTVIVGMFGATGEVMVDQLSIVGTPSHSK